MTGIQSFEAGRIGRGVFDGVLDVATSEVILNEPRGAYLRKRGRLKVIGWLERLESCP